MRNFVLLLAEKGRAARFEEIAREFERLAPSERASLDAELTTAVELSDAEARAIVRRSRRPQGARSTPTRRSTRT